MASFLLSKLRCDGFKGDLLATRMPSEVRHPVIGGFSCPDASGLEASQSPPAVPEGNHAKHTDTGGLNVLTVAFAEQIL
jgi:hypothetical protein